MVQSKYLTGDKAGIEAFIDRFDVSDVTYHREKSC